MIEMLYARENYEMAKRLLDVSELRQQAYASNLANVETPGYRRLELDRSFESQLRDAVRSGDIDQLRSFKPGLVEDTQTQAVRPDGNNVSVDSELLAMNRNALEQEFLSQYVSSSLKRLKSAITSKVQ